MKNKIIPVGVVLEKPKLNIKTNSLPTPADRIEWSNAIRTILPPSNQIDMGKNGKLEVKDNVVPISWGHRIRKILGIKTR